MTLSFDRLLRILPVTLVLLLSAIIPFAASQQQMLLVLGAIGAVIGALLFLFNPYLGFIALIIGSQFVPFEISTGTQTNINIAILLVVAITATWIIEALIQPKSLPPLHGPTTLPLVLLVLTTALSLLIGQMRWFPVSGAPITSQVGGFAIFVLSALAFLITAQQIRDLIWIERLTWLFMVVAALFMLGSFYMTYINKPIFRTLAPLFKQGTGGGIFWVWVMVLPLGQILFNQKLSLGWKIALAALILVYLNYRLIQTREWTSGWFPPLVAAAVILLLKDWRLSLALMIAGVIGAATIGPSLYQSVVVGDNEYSVVTRLEAWRILGDIIQVSPVFGLGPANYYFYTPLFGIMGYFVTFNSHNNYVDLLAQSGLLGLVFYLWFFWACAALAWNLRSRAPQGFLQGYIFGCLGGIVGTLVAGMMGDWVIPFVYNIGFKGFRSSFLSWMFLGGLVVIHYALAKIEATAEPHAIPTSQISESGLHA